jgi:hypothetical protein
MVDEILHLLQETDGVRQNRVPFERGLIDPA